MKTNLIKRTLSLAIVVCMVIAMVAVAPMASAAGNPSLTLGIDVYEYTASGNDYVRASIYLIGYYGWENPINNMEVHMNFDNTKLTYTASNTGANPYKAFTTPAGMTVSASTGSTGISTANTRGYVVFLTDTGPVEDEETGDEIYNAIPEASSAEGKVYLRTYQFTVKEGATGDCNFSFDTAKVYVTNFEGEAAVYIINGNLRPGDTALTATYTIPGAAVNYTISYNANGGAGTMADTVAEAPVVAANAFTRAGYTFAGWNTAADGNGETVAVGAELAADTALYATWTANATSEVASWYKMIGAQAREATGTKSAGLRFGVNLADLVPGTNIQEAGMIVIPTDLLLEGELTHDTPDCATGEFTGYLNDPTDNSLIYTAVLVNIPEGQEARPITARGFVKVNGNYYYTAPIVRNYAEVLALLQAMH